MASVKAVRANVRRKGRPSPVTAGTSVQDTFFHARYPQLLASILLLGFGLRLVLLAAYPLREDEAIYSYWALHGLHVDPLFLTVWPDKPPLFLWTLGASFWLFGETAPAARVANIFVSTLTIAVLAATARHLWSRAAAMGTAVLAALSPFAVSFAPTALTDPLLVLAGTFALLCAVRARAVWAGVWLGIAIMTKQPGILFAPLIAGALLLAVRSTNGASLRSLALAFLGLLAVVGPVVLWDSLRWSVAPSPWDLGGRNYVSLQLLDPARWPGRARAWISLLYLNFPDWRLWLLYGGSVIALLGFASTPARGRSPAFPLLFLAWGAGWLLLHLVSTVPVWDRYLLPVTVPLVLLGGWAIGGAGADDSTARRAERLHTGRDRAHAAVLGVVMLLLLPSAVDASRGRVPLGGDHGAYSGFDQLVSNLPPGKAERAADGQAPAEIGTIGDRKIVLYHDVLGWLLQFYLFEEVQADRVELRWFPSSTYLADNVEKTSHLRKFYLAPDWATDSGMTRTLERRGLTLVEHARAGHFVLYEFAPVQVSFCDWCRCRPTVPWRVLGDSAAPSPVTPVPASGKSVRSTQN